MDSLISLSLFCLFVILCKLNFSLKITLDVLYACERDVRQISCKPYTIVTCSLLEVSELWSGSFQAVSGSCQPVVEQLSSIFHHAAVRKSSGSHQAVIRQSSGNHQTVIRLSSYSIQTVRYVIHCADLEIEGLFSLIHPFSIKYP